MNNRRNRMKKTRWRKWWSVGDICNVDVHFSNDWLVASEMCSLATPLSRSAVKLKRENDQSKDLRDWFDSNPYLIYKLCRFSYRTRLFLFVKRS